MNTGVDEMAQPIKCLMHKHGDLSLVLRARETPEHGGIHLPSLAGEVRTGTSLQLNGQPD